MQGTAIDGQDPQPMPKERGKNIANGREQPVIEALEHRGRLAARGQRNGGGTDVVNRIQREGAREKVIDLALERTLDLVEEETYQHMKRKLTLPGEGRLTHAMVLDKGGIAQTVKKSAQSVRE